MGVNKALLPEKTKPASLELEGCLLQALGLLNILGLFDNLT